MPSLWCPKLGTSQVPHHIYFQVKKNQIETEQTEDRTGAQAVMLLFQRGKIQQLDRADK
jgi:hypothetical protein